MSKQKYDFEKTWDSLLTIVKNSGAVGAVEHIRSEPDAKKRDAWFGFFAQGLAFREWPNPDIDIMVSVGEAAIANALQQANEDEQNSNEWTDKANIHCYNVSANLADCWKDQFKRQSRHFEVGLELANRAIAFREQLDKGPKPRAMAYWIKGKHLLSLGRYEESETAFATALDFDKSAADLSGDLGKPSSHWPFGVLVNWGFVGLARAKRGDDEGQKAFEETLDVFRDWLDDEKKKGDAEVGIMELEESMRLN